MSRLDPIMDVFPDEARRLLAALQWGDPALEGKPDPLLEEFKVRLQAFVAETGGGAAA